MSQASKTMTTVSGESHFLEEQMNPVRIKQYLDASRDYEKSKGMKWLLAMMSKGRDASEFFSDVVKNVVVKSVEVKKMVYMYLEHYADSSHTCRELALLSINSFQKDLGASNQLIRGMALRVMTSIRVADIVQIQLLAIKKCAADSSPYVRKCAANAIAKVHTSDLGDKQVLYNMLATLLNDASTMVLGSAVIAFAEVCPERWELLHPAYRKLCHLVADVDEWAQIVILQTLTRYVRSQFVDPAPGSALTAKVLAQRRSAAGKRSGPRTIKRRTVKKAFYSDEEDESLEEELHIPDEPEDLEDGESEKVAAKATIADPDHRLALRSSLPLLKSRNSGVVLAVCALHYYGGGLDADTHTAQQCGRALVRILRNRREIQYVVLKSIAAIASERPAVFRPFLKEFFVKETDAGFNRELKLDILTNLATTENATPILRELETYARSADIGFASSAVRAAGRVADAQPDVARAVCSGLLALVAARNAAGNAPDKLHIVSTAIVVVRQLLQQGACGGRGELDSGRREVVRRLARLLLHPLATNATQTAKSQLRGALARANVVWLLGEFRDCCKELLPDAVRLLAANFAQDDVQVKQQILNLAVKAAIDNPDDKSLGLLLRYVLELSRFDLNHDLRDRARYMTSLLGFSTEYLKSLAPDLLLAEKRPPLTLTGPVALSGVNDLQVGTLSIMVGHQVEGYLHLPEWPDIPPDPATRDVAPPKSQQAPDVAPHNKPSAQPSVDQDVRDFYSRDEQDDEDDDDEEEEEEEEEGEEDEDDEEEDEEDEEEEDDEEEDEDDEDDDEEEEEDDDVEENDEDDDNEEDDDDEDEEETREAAAARSDPFAVFGKASNADMSAKLAPTSADNSHQLLSLYK